MCDGYGNEDCTETWRSGASWNDAACDASKPYICGVCPSTSTNPTRFEYIADGLSQPDAEFQCTINGGHLASVHSEADSDLLDSMIDENGGSSTWIGYHDRPGEAGCTDDRHQGIGGNIAAETFIWTDGTASDYEDWAGGEPNDWQYFLQQARCDGTGNEDCAEIWRSGQDWNDANCDGRRPYICGYSQAVASGIICTTPADTTGYVITAEADLSVGGFDVSVSCAAGYEGTAGATACATAGDYALAGCTATLPCCTTRACCSLNGGCCVGGCCLDFDHGCCVGGWSDGICNPSC
jgi:hypothetical protein